MIEAYSLTPKELGVKPFEYRGDLMPGDWVKGSLLAKGATAVEFAMAYGISQDRTMNICTSAIGLMGLATLAISLYCDYNMGMNLLRIGQNIILETIESSQSPKIR